MEILVSYGGSYDGKSSARSFDLHGMPWCNVATELTEVDHSMLGPCAYYCIMHL